MLYSLKKRDRTWETKRQKHKLKKMNYEIIPTPCPPIPHPHVNQPPHSPIPFPIIHNNNTVDTEFQIQMRQSNKCESARNDEIFNLHLGSGAGPWVNIPCLLQDTSHIYWFHPPKQLTTKPQIFNRTFLLRSIYNLK